MTEEQNSRPIFKTIKSFEKPYGTRNFVEVALKETNEGENTFFSISKGFTTQTGVKRYKKSLGFQVDGDIQQFLIESLQKLLSEFKDLPKKEVPKTEEKTPSTIEETKTE